MGGEGARLGLCMGIIGSFSNQRIKIAMYISKHFESNTALAQSVRQRLRIERSRVRFPPRSNFEKCGSSRSMKSRKRSIRGFRECPKRTDKPDGCVGYCIVHQCAMCHTGTCVLEGTTHTWTMSAHDNNTECRVYIEDHDGYSRRIYYPICAEHYEFCWKYSVPFRCACKSRGFARIVRTIHAWNWVAGA